MGGEYVYLCFNHGDQICDLSAPIPEVPGANDSKSDDEFVPKPGVKYGHCVKCKGRSEVKERIRCAECQQQFFQGSEENPLLGECYNCKNSNARGAYFYKCSKHDTECSLFPE